MDLGLEGRTAVVTGGAGRIGREDCRVLAEEGAEVVVLDVDSAGAEETVAELETEQGATAHAVTCDLTDREDVADAVAAIEADTGGIDVLVNNAGLVDGRGRVGSFPDDVWDRDVELNLTGTYNVTKAVFPGMKERGWGRIVTMSSVAGWHGAYGQLSYSATKASLIGFGKTLALEGAQHGITSNVVAPTLVSEELSGLSPGDLAEYDEYLGRLAEATPMRRVGSEADVANLVAYLASEQANYVTGQVVGITGGVDLFSF
jgi:3-oxoacyl-[acyl-carrier protein] reductase